MISFRQKILIAIASSAFALAGLGIVTPAAAQSQVTATNPAGKVTDQSSTAIGGGSNSVGTGNVTIGQGALAAKADGSSVNYGIAIGRIAKSTGNYSTAIGQSASAAEASAAYGSGANAEGRASVAIGSSARASGTNGASVAIGSSASALATGSVALGAGASATQDNSLALGAGASTTTTNSVAIGAQSVATEQNTVSVGSISNQRRITNVAAGINATDAANYGQVQAVQNQIGSVATDLNTFKQETRSGIAATAAMVNPVMPSAPGKISVAANMSTYHGQMGIGTAFAYRPTVSPTIVHGGFGFAGNETVARVGVSTEF